MGEVTVEDPIPLFPVQDYSSESSSYSIPSKVVGAVDVLVVHPSCDTWGLSLAPTMYLGTKETCEEDPENVSGVSHP